LYNIFCVCICVESAAGGCDCHWG